MFTCWQWCYMSLRQEREYSTAYIPDTGVGGRQELVYEISRGSVCSGTIIEISRGGLEKFSTLTYACSFLLKYCDNLIATQILIAIGGPAWMSEGFSAQTDTPCVPLWFHLLHSVYSSASLMKYCLLLKHNRSETYWVDKYKYQPFHQ